MKNQDVKFVLMALFLASILLVGLGCSEDEECLTDSSVCGTFTACCTSSDCYYLAGDGTRFDCNGTDCSSAAGRLADYICGKSASTVDYNNTVDQILEAAQERVIILR